ncbi:hypothetical protein ACQJBY_072753 [Aegilops geniculata]
MVSYLTMEDELSCDAWLAISADIIGRSRGEPFWEQVHEKFHARKHIAPYDMYIIQPRKRCCIAGRLSRSASPSFATWFVSSMQCSHCTQQRDEIPARAAMVYHRKRDGHLCAHTVG